MAIEFRVLTRTEMDAARRNSRGTINTKVPYLGSDDMDGWDGDKLQGVYFTALDKNRVVGTIKVHKNPYYTRLDNMNAWRAENGLPVITGDFYAYNYIGVSPDYRRRGVATGLQNMLRDILKPGDVVEFSSHEPDGIQFNNAWLSSLGSSANILLGDFKRYDPRKVNYYIRDSHNFPGLASRVAARWLSTRERVNRGLSKLV